MLNQNDNMVRNILAKALGAFWLFDGLLQFQPQMFGPAFVTNILTPLFQGQPGFVHPIIQLGITLWNTNTVWTNTAAALLQTAIGIFLLFPRSSKAFKAAAYVSIVWGLVVWVFGECFGMLLTGGASFYSGAPGAVLAYVLLAVFLLLSEKIPLRLYTRVAGWSLIVLGLLQLQPIFWTSDGIQALFMGSMDTLGFISAFPTYLGTLAAAHVVAANLLLMVVPILLGTLILAKPNRTTGIITLVFLFLVWWLNQDFGMLSTLISGTSTDPNSAPLFALFVLPIFW